MVVVSLRCVIEYCYIFCIYVSLSYMPVEGAFVYDAHKSTPSLKSEKLNLLWRLPLTKSHQVQFWIPNVQRVTSLFNRSFPGMVCWTLEAGLGFKHTSACCPQLVNVLPLKSSFSFFLSCLSALSLSISSHPVSPPRERVWSGISWALFPKSVGFVVSSFWSLAGPGCRAET